MSSRSWRGVGRGGKLMVCPYCGSPNKAGYKFCATCGKPVQVVTTIAGGNPMEKRYKALRAVGTFYKVLGIIAGIVTILIVLGICGISLSGGAILSRLARDNPNASFLSLYSGFLGIVWAVVALIYGGGVTLTLFAAGEGIYLLLGLEENTRLTSMLLQQQNFQSLPQNPQPVQPYPAPVSP